MSAAQNRLASACLSQTPRFGRISLGVDHPREVCGVFGGWAPGRPVANLVFYGLYALQHRGQESAGMAVADGCGMLVYREMGLVSEVFDEATLATLQGHLAIGHTRDSTTGSWAAQPAFKTNAAGGGIVVAHNGNLTNAAALTGATDSAGVAPGLARSARATSDTEVIVELLARRSTCRWSRPPSAPWAASRPSPRSPSLPGPVSTGGCARPGLRGIIRSGSRMRWARTSPPAGRDPTVDSSAAEPRARGREMIRNLPIRSKLIGLLIAPLLALTLLTSLGIGANLATKVEAQHLRQEIAVATTLSRLVHELQDERDLTAGWVAGGRAAAGLRSLDDQQTRVNRALEAFGKDAQTLEDDGSPFYSAVQRAQAGSDKLAEVRQRVEDNPTTTTGQQVLDFYSELIGNLLAADFEIARNADNHTLTRSVAAFVAMARLTEAASKERGLLHAVTAAGQFAPGEVQRLSALVGAQDSWRSQFDVAATPEQHQALDQSLERADSEQAIELRDGLVGTEPDVATTAPSPKPITVGPEDWYRAATARLKLLRGIEGDVAGDVDAAAAAVQDGGSRRALIYTVILTALLWLTVGLVLLMARSMVQPLRTLTDTANEVAEVRLPSLVDQLQRAEDPRELDVVPEPVPVNSHRRDRPGRPGVQPVQETAIRVAVEQAELRRASATCSSAWPGAARR